MKPDKEAVGTWKPCRLGGAEASPRHSARARLGLKDGHHTSSSRQSGRKLQETNRTIIRTLRILLLGLCTVAFAVIAKAGDTNPFAGEWPTDAQNFKVLEYYFDAATHRITVVFWEVNSAFVYSGIKVMRAGSDLKFTVLYKIGGGGAHNDPMFKDTEDRKWKVSFEAHGFDPKQGKLIYQGATPTDTREIPYKGARSEPPARQRNEHKQISTSTPRPLALSITVQDKDRSFTVRLENTGNKPVKYVDMLKPRPGDLDLAGNTEILVRDKNRRILSKINGGNSDGYTWAIFQSQAYPASYSYDNRIRRVERVEGSTTTKIRSPNRDAHSPTTHES